MTLRPLRSPLPRRQPSVPYRPPQPAVASRVPGRRMSIIRAHHRYRVLVSRHAVPKAVTLICRRQSRMSPGRIPPSLHARAHRMPPRLDRSTSIHCLPMRRISRLLAQQLDRVSSHPCPTSMRMRNRKKTFSKPYGNAHRLSVRTAHPKACCRCHLQFVPAKHFRVRPNKNPHQ